MENYLNFAKDIALKAGKIMLDNSNLNKNIEYKGDKTIVTKVDKEINKLVIQSVKSKFPNHCIDGEEEQYGNGDYVWVCDPIDGTAMYARNIPVSTFSLALVINGVPTVGVVYDPFTNNMITAIKGKGAYQNNKKIMVNDYKIDDLRSMGHCDFGSKVGYNIIDILNNLSKTTYTIDIGSIVRAGMCVANGEFTYAIFHGTKHKNCDIAALKVIVEEAGGVVTNLFGEDQRYDMDIKGAIICNKVAYQDVLRIVTESMYKNKMQ